MRTNQLVQVWFILDGFLSCEKLQKNDTETIYIRLFTESRGPCIFWINVANRAEHVSWSMCFGWWNAFGNAKIWDTSFKVLIEKYVWWFYIAVYDPWITVMVKIGESLCSTDCYFQSRIPIKLYFLRRSWERRYKYTSSCLLSRVDKKLMLNQPCRRSQSDPFSM